MQMSSVACSQVGNETITCGRVFHSGELRKRKVSHINLRSGDQGGHKSFTDILLSNTLCQV